MIPARVSIVFLGVKDMSCMRAFFRQLGWPEQSTSNDQHVMYHTGGAILGLYPEDDLRADADVAGEDGSEVRPFTLAVNLESKEAVDRAFAHLEQIEAEITKPPENVFWGGYSGYFRDPEGNLWEVAHNPFVEFDDRGALILGE
ncbi:MAG: VOC family protein [Chloroflexota bacterium]